MTLEQKTELKYKETQTIEKKNEINFLKNELNQESLNCKFK